MISQSLGHSSSEKPSHHEGDNSYFYVAFHSREMHLPKVEVNKFYGLDPTSWVTQMKHYFSLHDITFELNKLHIGVLYLDPK
jgi:hypothetical protein